MPVIQTWVIILKILKVWILQPQGWTVTTSVPGDSIPALAVDYSP